MCLTATNQYGSDSVCKLIYVDGNIPTADFSYDSIATPTLIFNDESINDPTAWHWDFGVGPGDTANTQNVAFKFPADGNYNVCLTAINKNGASAPYCKMIKVGYLGIENLGNTSIDLFPNPMTDFATIRISSDLRTDQFDVVLYNVLGKEVPARIDRLNNDIRLYKDNLPSGHYIVEVRSQKQGVARMQLQIND